MLLRSRSIEVADDLRIDDKGREVYPESPVTRTTDKGKKMHVYGIDDALIVVEPNDDLAKVSAACQAKYGKTLVEIVNGQGLPLTATNYVQEHVKVPVVNAKILAVAQKFANKMGITLEEAIEIAKG